MSILFEASLKKEIDQFKKINTEKKIGKLAVAIKLSSKKKSVAKNAPKIER